MLLRYQPQLALHHNADAGTERVRFLHRVRRQHGAPLAVEAGQYRVPQESLRLGIHTGGRFVKQDNFGRANHGHGVAQLAARASGTVLRLFVGMLGDVQPRQVGRHQPVQILPRNAPNARVQLQMFPHRNVLPQGVVLRTIAERLERIVLVDGNTVPSHPDRPPRGRRLARHDLHGGGLAGTVVTEQTKHLAGFYRKRQTSHGHLLARWFVVRTATAGTVPAERLLGELLA